MDTQHIRPVAAQRPRLINGRTYWVEPVDGPAAMSCRPEVCPTPDRVLPEPPAPIRVHASS
ncbi:hypothetical protein [Roseomonas sp. BN140053]|uniref:hypothetical protein n=1 Tax=Roseomonas sp. BN140053 TaxID=3391898 RepID=UPI0039EB8C45